MVLTLIINIILFILALVLTTILYFKYALLIPCSGPGEGKIYATKILLLLILMIIAITINKFCGPIVGCICLGILNIYTIIKLTDYL